MWIIRSMGGSVRRFLYRRNDSLRVLEVDVSRDRKAEKTALLLTMNHRDDSGAVFLFNGPDRLSMSRGVPSPHGPKAVAP